MTDEQIAQMREMNRKEHELGKAAEGLWDTVKGQILQLYFDGKATKPQVWCVKRLFIAGFKGVVSTANTPEEWAQMVVDKFDAAVIGGQKLSVAMRFNRKDWEGTLAHAMCGVYGHFFIGKKGGIEATVYKKGQKMKAKRNPDIYGWEH